MSILKLKLLLVMPIIYCSNINRMYNAGSVYIIYIIYKLYLYYIVVSIVQRGQWDNILLYIYNTSLCIIY